MSTDIELYAKDAREQLKRWDQGGIIWSIEMGGLSPGYEQALQILAIEIVRDYLDKVLPDSAVGDWGDMTVSRIDKMCGGFSGAQVGVAKYLAYCWLKIGPAALLKKYPHERHIQVTNFWPHVEK